VKKIADFSLLFGAQIVARPYLSQSFTYVTSRYYSGYFPCFDRFFISSFSFRRRVRTFSFFKIMEEELKFKLKLKTDRTESDSPKVERKRPKKSKSNAKLKNEKVTQSGQQHGQQNGQQSGQPQEKKQRNRNINSNAALKNGSKTVLITEPAAFMPLHQETIPSELKSFEELDGIIHPQLIKTLVQDMKFSGI
jgi:FtsZ-interacting cell division protein YlmF